MKKTLTLILTISLLIIFKPFVLYGQGLLILDRAQNDLTNGELIVAGYASDQVLKAEIFFKNNDDEVLPVLLRKVEEDILPGTINYFCWNGSCLSDLVYEVDDPIILSPGEISTPDDFYAEYLPEGNTGTSVIKYEFFAPEDEFEKVYVTVNFITEDDNSNNITKANFNNLSVESIYPNPANNFAIVEISNTKQQGTALLQVFSIAGSLVLENHIDMAEKKHSLDLSALNRGVYMLTLNFEGKSVSTRKLIISR